MKSVRGSMFSSESVALDYVDWFHGTFEDLGPKFYSEAYEESIKKFQERFFALDTSSVVFSETLGGVLSMIF